jgi:hypothetical protein
MCSRKKPRCAPRCKTHGLKSADGAALSFHATDLYYPANTQRACRQGSSRIDRDSPESGEDEAFRGSIEAGGPPIWKEIESGELNQTANRGEPQMPGVHERGDPADGAIG